VFEATPQSLLEIHTGMMAAPFFQKIPCGRLCIDEDSFSADMNQEAEEEAINKKTDGGTNR